MSNPTCPIDDAMIDDLVSGDLTGARYREVLRSLDAQPERWRDCALAFLHEQALVQDLSVLAQNDVDWDATGFESTSPTPQNLTSAGTPEVTSQGDIFVTKAGTQTVTRVQKETSYSRLQWMHRLTMIAAMLLISFTIGWYGSGMRQTTTGSNPTAIDTEHLAIVAQPSNSPAEPRSSDFGGNTPLRNLQFTSGQFIPVDRKMPAQLRELEQRGIVEIEMFDAFVRVNLGDGSTGMVPVQQYEVRPIIYSY